MHNMGGATGDVDHDAAIMLGLVGDPFEEHDDVDDPLHADLKEDSDSDADDDDRDSGPPPLESVDQMHVFFYYVGCGTELDIVENFIGDLEAPPMELKCLTNQRDFKTDLTPVQNVILAIGISQRTVVVCTQRFIDKDLQTFCTAAGLVMAEDERRAKIQVLLSQDAAVPKELQSYAVFKLAEDDALDRLSRTLSSGPVPKDQYKPEPTAPPLDTIAEDVISTDAVDIAVSPVSPVYQNGSVVTKITSGGRRRYSRREVDAPDELGSGSRSNVAQDDYCCLDVYRGLCPAAAAAAVAPRTVVVPPQLQQRGLMVHRDEYEEILVALRDATAVKFFQKSVYCSLPRLYLCIILIMAATVIPLWFLTVGTAKRGREPREDLSAVYFWSFFLIIVVTPATVALVSLAVLVRMSSKKYLKFRIKVEEFNKRFRETNLVLHCRRSFWRCSGTLRLYFMYYNFEECQQTLYYFVYDNMKNGAHDSTCNSSSATTDVNVVNVESRRGPSGLSNGDLCSPGGYADCCDIPTIKMDKILKRVNTLRKKYEWDYFDDLTTKRLPETDERQHRKGGMCFCQYVLLRSGSDVSSSWIEQLTERCEGALRSALRKSGPRPSLALPLSPANGGSGEYRTAATLPKPDVIYI